jgi:hypothetical protein
MDRRAGRMQVHPVLWTAATVRKRTIRGESVIAHMRRYFGRMVVVLTLMTPLLVVLTYQWTPRRDPRHAEPLAPIVVASSVTPSSSDHAVVTRPLTRLEPAERPASSDPLTSVSLVDRTETVRPTAWYREAAAEQGVSPYLLEALHQIESSAAPDGCWPNIDGSGAVGPFQFKQATFESHGIDGNGDGVVDICGFADSLYSAAAYLKWLGADADLDSPSLRAALTIYGTDADRVIDLARYYRARDLALTAESVVSH